MGTKYALKNIKFKDSKIPKISMCGGGCGLVCGVVFRQRREGDGADHQGKGHQQCKFDVLRLIPGVVRHRGLDDAE